MSKIKSLILLIFFISFNSYACISDAECGYGNKCVQAPDSINPTGTCITPVDENGIPQTDGDDDGSSPHVVKGCDFDSDCAPGFSCMKHEGDLQGICIK